MKSISIWLFLIMTFLACEEKIQLSDSYGNFEAVSTISSESHGRLLFFTPKEGQRLRPNVLVGQVDTIQLHLQLKKLDATIGVLPRKLRNTEADIQVLIEQRKNLEREKNRVTRLVEKNAATSQQLDELSGQIEVVNRQLSAIESQTETANEAIMAEKAPLIAQRALIADQIKRTSVFNPIEGIVLTRLAEPGEIVSPGTPLYRIANLDTVLLRFYVDAVQLQSLSLGKKVYVSIDAGEKGYSNLDGTINWISEQAEFTPKTIQTKEDRVHLTYAVRAMVANPEGKLKIGMPAEVNFQRKNDEVDQ